MRYYIKSYNFLCFGKTLDLRCIADDENLGDTKEVFCKKLKKAINCGEAWLRISQLRSIMKAEFCPQRQEYQFHEELFYLDF